MHRINHAKHWFQLSNHSETRICSMLPCLIFSLQYLSKCMQYVKLLKNQTGKTNKLAYFFGILYETMLKKNSNPSVLWNHSSAISETQYTNDIVWPTATNHSWFGIPWKHTLQPNCRRFDKFQFHLCSKHPASSCCRLLSLSQDGLPPVHLSMQKMVRWYLPTDDNGLHIDLAEGYIMVVKAKMDRTWNMQVKILT